MSTVKIEIFVARTPDEVFAYVRDYANQAIWQKENIIELTVEPPGPANVGTRIHKARRTPGGEVRFTMEITEMDESAGRWAEQTITGSLQGTQATWQVLPEGNGSKVIHIAEFHATGFSKLLLPLITSAARKDFNSEFANLKKILETGH
jgi:hypothetical protein